MRRFGTFLGVLLISLGASQCNFPGVGNLNTPPGPTDTPAPPTATSVPLAASVAGSGITLEQFEAEIARFEAEQSRAGIDLATIPDYRAHVLSTLIDLRLLAQGAIDAGYEIAQEHLEARIEELQLSLGTPADFDTWLDQNLYSPESFRSALGEELLAAEMVSRIIETVAMSAEQAHARHILVATEEEAENLRSQILGGEDFGEIAQIYSIDASTRPAGGDLGWFPEGYLLWPEIDAAVFELVPNELSQVIQSELGYHLVEVLERGAHPLDFEARLYLQEKAVQDWLTEQRGQKDVQIFIEI